MERLGADDVLRLLLALAVLLLTARALGEAARRLGQPAVLGEILAGLVLGPTVLGRAAPGLAASLFPASGPATLALDGIAGLAIVLFLFVAGVEVDLSTLVRQGRVAVAVGVAGIALPFAMGLACGWVAPDALGRGEGVGRGLFAVFLATALSISALPVIARTLMDLGLYRTSFGMTVLAAAVLDDLAGWTIFAAVLGAAGKESAHAAPAWAALAFAAASLTLVRWAVHRALPWILERTSRPAGVLSFAVVLALAGAVAAEACGLHAIFGAFLAGIALGDSAHLPPATRGTIGEFVTSVFAPVFFATIGLRLDFAAHFDPLLCGAVLVVASLGKVLGCGLGARLCGMAPPSAWAVGFAMNARGAMEVILGLSALHAGLIRERLFVALVVMALATSLLSGPALRALLGAGRGPGADGKGKHPQGPGVSPDGSLSGETR